MSSLEELNILKPYFPNIAFCYQYSQMSWPFINWSLSLNLYLSFRIDILAIVKGNHLINKSYE